MADVLRIKRRYTGGAAGAPLTLANGELAYNEVDDKLYYGKGNNAGQATSIIPIAGPGMGYAVGGGSITMADVPPSTPAAGQGWWDSTSGQLYLYYSDPNSSQWVPAFNIPAGAATTPFLPIAGGTLTGNLTISQPTGWSALTLNTAAGNRNQLNSQRGGLSRWGIDFGNDVAETGSNVGTDFVINRFADNGSYIGQVLWIYRSTGNVAIVNNLDVGYGVGTAAVGLELGSNRTGNGSAFIDLHAAAGAGDYDFRIMRYSGTNGDASIENVGTGSLYLRAASSSFVAVSYSFLVGTSAGTLDAAIGIGRYRGGAGYSYIDFYTTNDDVYDLRIIRDTLVNGNAAIQLGGTGVLHIQINGATQATFATGNYSLTLSNTLAAAGIQCRPGVSGTPIANTFNINWTGVAYLWIDGVNCGQITLTSDYRIKENVVDLPTMWDRVKALRPISYTIKESPRLLSRESPEEEWGFIAHELQDTLIPSASTGYKDAPNILQSPNIMTLVASLTRALQEAMERIENLESRIAILSGA
jgi:hypothetical protein